MASIEFLLHAAAICVRIRDRPEILYPVKDLLPRARSVPARLDAFLQRYCSSCALSRVKLHERCGTLRHRYRLVSLQGMSSLCNLPRASRAAPLAGHSSRNEQLQVAKWEIGGFFLGGYCRGYPLVNGTWHSELRSGRGAAGSLSRPTDDPKMS